jgi:drug/metabolite transporter (DMT)-like permease
MAERNSHPLSAPRLRLLTLAAFAVIYFVWGSTFLAIRVAVRQAPPLLLAGLRFTIAGAALYGWMRARGVPASSRRQWLSILPLAFVMFMVDYGILFWAEQRVPSGVAAVMLATIPLFMALSEILFLRTQKFTPRLALALAVGLGGVAVLTGQSLNLGATPIDIRSALALMFGAFSWSVASVLGRKMPLPESKLLSSGAQMLTGGVMLLLASAATGEFSRFHPTQVSRGAWIALLYLIVAGSIVGFTAYVWLLHRESPTKVATYAYVNPLVAVLLGYFFMGEQLGLRTALGTLLVLVSVVVITTTRKNAGTR